MAAAQGLSPASIHRIWHAHGLQPHRVRTFKLSTDPDAFAEDAERLARFQREAQVLASVVAPKFYRLGWNGFRGSGQ